MAPLLAVLVGLVGGAVLLREWATALSVPASPPARVFVAASPDPSPWPTPTSTLSERDPTPDIQLVMVVEPTPRPTATPNPTHTALLAANALATVQARPQECRAELPQGATCIWPKPTATAKPPPPTATAIPLCRPEAAMTDHICKVGTPWAGTPVVYVPTPTPTWGGHP